MTDTRIQDAAEAFFGLSLSSVTVQGRALGLQAGDILLRMDGLPFDGETATLSKRFRMEGARQHMLSFWRDGREWHVFSATPALGRWRRVAWPENVDAAGVAVRGMRNWEVMVHSAKHYDAQPQRPSWLAFLAPVYLIQMRLWGGLALWVALGVLCLPLGWVAGLGLEAVICFYFWHASPALVRADRMERGFRIWRVIAAPSETALHRQMADLAPDLSFVHAPEPLGPAA